MAKVYVFGDEAGNFDFSVKPGASKYFLIGTVALRRPEVGVELLALRRDLAHRGIGLDSAFHASEDTQAVRNEVFTAIQAMDFRFDVTILEKRKTRPHLQANHDRFYKEAWFLHFKFLCPRITGPEDELLVVASSLGTQAKRGKLRAALHDVVNQSAKCRANAAFWPCASDPCLLIADYCTWAVQRKLERGDDRSYQLVRGKISTEFKPFDAGSTYYY